MKRYPKFNIGIFSKKEQLRLRTRRFELLRPEELADERIKNSLIYLPVGLLEWHSYAMPMGTDGIAAQRACLAAAEKTGGVVLPALYLAPALRREDGITAMEPDDSCAKSIFFSPEVFERTIDEYVRELARQGYRRILLVAGHGSDGFTDVMEHVCEKQSEEGKRKVMLTHAWATWDVTPYSLGHATILETALMMYLTDSVALEKLPPLPLPLSCREYGFDSPRANADGSVNETDDPRKATAALGEKLFVKGVENIVKLVNSKEFTI